MENEKKDVYEIITSRIIQQLEQGKVPWKQPWAASGLPQNLVSKRSYQAINIWLLLSLGYEQNYFLTYKQIKEIGATLKKGERACPVVFWTWLEPKKEDIEQAEREKKKRPKAKPMLRYYMVYNIAQCDGIPAHLIPTLQEGNNNTPIEICEQIVADMPNKPEIKHKENSAYYHPLHDYINMPKLKSFDSSESYYITLFHELVHSTGHLSRLNRSEITDMESLGGDAYSAEELVAEIGACYLSSYAGILHQEFDNNVAYIQSWLKKLKNDKKCIIYASAKAQKAVDFIRNVYVTESEEVLDEAS